MNYKDFFLTYVSSLTTGQITTIGKSEQDIYWNGSEFYTWAHGVRNDHGDKLIFDSTTAEGPFNAKNALMDFSVTVDDLIEASHDN